MGTEKKSKSGSELPKGSAAPSCNPRLCACPGRCCFRGAAPKGSCPRPGLAGVSWVSQRSPITSAAPSPSASIGSGSCGGSCIKSWHPGAPFPAWRGGRGRQPGRGPGAGWGDPACLALLLWRRPRQSGTPSRGVGRRTKPSGHGDTHGHLSPARLLGFGGSGGSLGWGLAGCAYQGQAAFGRFWVRVCCLCPDEDRSDFRGRLGGLTVPPHGCSPTDVTQGGSGQI